MHTCNCNVNVTDAFTYVSWLHELYLGKLNETNAMLTQVEPRNTATLAKMEWAHATLTGGGRTVPSTIQAEKEHNVFMRIAQAEVSFKLMACERATNSIAFPHTL